MKPMEDSGLPETETTLDGGLDTSTSTPEAPAAQESTPPPTLDLDEYGSYAVPITVDGQEQFVPLSDLRGGYMRQADYTQKTQAVASQREALEQAQALQSALEEDPARTLAILQAVYAADADDGAAAIEDEMMDPVERRLREVEARFEAEDQERQKSELLSELDAYNERYGVDQRELLQFAMDNDIPRLDWAYATMAQTVAAAQAEVESQTQAAEDARLDAKRGASFVAGGTSTSPSSAAAPVGKAQTIREAFEQARGQLGLA